MGKLEDLAKALDGAIGENSAEQQVRNFVDFGYAPLNRIISGDYNGGAPVGRLMEMYGPSSSGKTALATMLMIGAQKQGGIVGFMDMERSFDLGLAQNMGLDTTPGRWIYKRPRTWEEANMLMSKAAETIRKSGVIADDAPIYFVLDSIAASVPKSVVDKGIDELSMNDTTALSRVTSTTLKSVATFADDFGFGVLYLNQIRTKPGVMYGDPTTTPGGAAMEFYSTARLALSRTKLFDKEKNFIGQEIGIRCVKSKLTRPMGEIKLRMMFAPDGTGYFDTTFSLVDTLIELGKLEWAQPRLTWEGKKYYKSEFVEFVNKNNLYQDLVNLLKS